MDLNSKIETALKAVLRQIARETSRFTNEEMMQFLEALANDTALHYQKVEEKVAQRAQYFAAKAAKARQ